ncbi:MAG: hypothetical protein M3271_02555 [Actinomycetota bacterium]|nr:hypothetical protein [Actinomycetota bacterium]
MENTPARDDRVRRLLVNPLAVAVVIVLLAAGGAFGWKANTSAPSAWATPETAVAALALERLPAESVCTGRGEQVIREAVLGGDGVRERERLADRLPKRSPLAGYERIRLSEVDPSGESAYLDGAVEGQVASFLPEGEGGFDVYAYRFLTRPAAAESIAGNVVRRVCELGATAFGSRGEARMIVLEERSGESSISAWWMSQSDVVTVRYAGGTDPDAALANLAVIAGATASR